MIKFIITSLIALIGAGAGAVAFLNYYDQKKAAEYDIWKRAEQNWQDFSPRAISGGNQRAVLRGADVFDLETGDITSNPEGARAQYDLQFICGPQFKEGLRAVNSTAWSKLGVIEITQVSYRKIRDANFSNKKPNDSYDNLYYSHKGNAPPKGTSFAVRTSNDNVAIVRIEGYQNERADPNICREIVLTYAVYPIAQDPPRPQRP